MFALRQNDLLALKQHGLSISQLEAQLYQLRQGMPPLNLLRPCRVGDGIVQLSPQQTAACHKQFHMAHTAGRISKFIPASGAATRMFQDLLQFFENQSLSPATKPTDLPLPESIARCWEQLADFPFITNLRHFFDTTGLDFQDLYQREQFATVFQALLQVPGLGYANLPKALLPFHQYPDGTRTALEEHVRESMMYAQQGAKLIRIHLTVSAQFEMPVKAHIERILQKVSRSGIQFDLTVSTQKPSTDTIALDDQGQPFRDEAGELVLRPGGHGALLDNLNEYQGDILFISNIDNVVPDYLKGQIVEWRMTLGGYLITLQEQIFHHLKELDSPQSATIEKAETFVRDHLHDNVLPSCDRMEFPGKVARLKQYLNRPLRVCGVVPNTGDAGGGPFWIQHADGSHSRQIVEQSQADPQSTLQQQLFSSATHFNPVDMVCGTRDYQDNPFNLLKFRDPQASFISHKTYEGRPLKALEWPGLWNGGMADWITLFVEIPRSSFNPVKTILDWLQPTHQPPSKARSS